MGMGDEILAAGHAQTVYDADPSRRVAICHCSGEPRWHELWDGNPIIARPIDVKRGEPVHRIKNASGCRPYVRYPFTRSQPCRFTTWRAMDHVGRLFLTRTECEFGERVAAACDRYFVIEPSASRRNNPNKTWIWDRWIELVRACPDVTFVQPMHSDSEPLLAPNVRHVDATPFRMACGVIKSAAGYIGTEGGLHHAAGVLGIPAVVIFGGFITPDTTGYPHHFNIYAGGPGSPCGRYTPCKHCRACMESITVDHVVVGVRAFAPLRQVSA
jgi:hypothetical protein